MSNMGSEESTIEENAEQDYALLTERYVNDPIVSFILRNDKDVILADLKIMHLLEKKEND